MIMTKYKGLKRSDKVSFIEGAELYSNPVNRPQGLKVTFTMQKDYFELLKLLSKKERTSKSQIIRLGIYAFSKLSRSEKDLMYEHINNDHFNIMDEYNL